MKLCRELTFVFCRRRGVHGSRAGVGEEAGRGEERLDVQRGGMSRKLVRRRVWRLAWVIIQDRLNDEVVLGVGQNAHGSFRLGRCMSIEVLHQEGSVERLF